MTAWMLKFSASALALAVALSASACGGGSTGTATTVAAGGAGGAGATAEAKITARLAASGATFPTAYYEQTVADFKKKQAGIIQAYGGGGSGKGRTDLQEQVVDWAGTDGLIAEADKAKYKGGEVLYFPTVAAPITVSFNLKGVDKLQLSADTVAKIFSRGIKNWDDTAIAADNPGVKLPTTAITVARRSDGSGTTENFTKFLVAASPTAWTLKSGSTVEWPTDTQAGNGNAGVAQIVKDTDGAIGYVDLSDAKASGLKFASIKNKAGKFVQPTLAGTTAALQGVALKDDLTYSPLWADGDAAYPIAAPTWIIVYKKQTDKAKGAAVKAWLGYVLGDGQKTAESLDYAALPDVIKSKAVAQLDKIELPA